MNDTLTLAVKALNGGVFVVLFGIVGGIDLGKLREVVPRDLALRFAFGAGISIIAGLAGLLVSSRFGGMFLAFPAILPATLTLLEEKDGTEHAVHDVRGAALGAI